MWYLCKQRNKDYGNGNMAKKKAKQEMQEKKVNPLYKKVVELLSSRTTRNIIGIIILFFSVFCMFILDEENAVLKQYIPFLSSNFIKNIMNYFNIQSFNISLSAWLIFLCVMGVLMIFIFAGIFAPKIVKGIAHAKRDSFRTELGARRFYATMYYLVVFLISAALIFMFVMSGGFAEFNNYTAGLFLNLLYTVLLCLMFAAISVIALIVLYYVIKSILWLLIFITQKLNELAKEVREEEQKKKEEEEKEEEEEEEEPEEEEPAPEEEEKDENEGNNDDDNNNGGMPDELIAKLEQDEDLEKDLFPALTAIDNKYAPEEAPAEEQAEETPAESTEEAVEQLVEENAEAPAEEQAEETPAESTEETVEQLVEENAEAPAEEQVEEKPAESMEEAVEQSVEENAEAPVQEPVEETVEEDITLSDFVLRFQSHAINHYKVYYELPLLRSFIAGLSSTRLIILEGLSGTGKSLLPRMFSRFTGSTARFSPVQATWRDKTDVLGFFSEFTKTFKITDFLCHLYESSYVDETTLMVLDEMNLSRIEYYFADFLSILEYPQEEWKIKVYEPEIGQKLPKKLTGGYVTIPANTWFIGTANTDDSTFTITDKVYDRAITLDFRERISPIKSDYKSDPISITAEKLQQLFAEAQENEALRLNEEETDKFLIICDFMRDAFDIRFGNRIMVQINQFVPVYVALGGTKEEALDFMFSSKVMRKLNGMFEDYVKDELVTLKKLLADTYGKGTFVETERIIAKILKRLV